MKNSLIIFIFLVTGCTLSAQVDVDKPIHMSGAADSDRAVTNLALPVNGTDAANKDYVDSQSGGLAHYVGELFGGGVVVAVWTESGVEKGLIMALTEQSGLKWQTSYSLVNANRSWDGNYDTNLMTNSPAKNYVTGLGSGWYIPSVDEFRFLWTNRFFVNKVLFQGGHTQLSNARYWTSSEYNTTEAFFFTMDYGGSGAADKADPSPVRAFRSF